MSSSDRESVRCPVCGGDFTSISINGHLDTCLEARDPPAKKLCSSLPGNKTSSSSSSFFQLKKDSVSGKQNLLSHVNNNNNSKGVKRALVEAGDGDHRDEEEARSSRKPDMSPPLRSTRPLAERLRPDSLEDYFGQEEAVGPQTLLRSLLDSQEVPSLILWGPPGCGKTTLAHIIASSIKKKGNARFVSLSATSASTSQVREVIQQAANQLRLFKRPTVLFIDEIHRFNKLQQDTFLPHVECGTITLIGATTENPSFQVNAALLSRCRVLVLEKLSVDAMRSILLRAVDALGVSVLTPDAGNLSNQQPADPEKSLEEEQAEGREPRIFIEQKALDTIAFLCDGDARTGLNSLQLAVQARLNAVQSQRSAGEAVVTEQHVKEGLQRSHILYDRAGEEHFNCISALHKSLRGSHQNAALYWLGRMLEGGEDPLYVARRLVRFASEDVGLADPAALPQAVSAYQACHFIGMPECEVILAQCVVYLARAPKSVDVYKAYANVKASLRSHRGPLPSVPLHLRNAPTRLMKELGYAEGYKYNPAFSQPVEQEYLPAELKDVDFFTWKPSGL